MPVDKKGSIRYSHSGEGANGKTATTIKQLLAECACAQIEEENPCSSRSQPISNQRRSRLKSITLTAASEIAFEYSNNDKDAYNLAQLALLEMIKKRSQPLDLDQELEILAPLSQLIH